MTALMAWMCPSIRSRSSWARKSSIEVAGSVTLDDWQPTARIMARSESLIIRPASARPTGHAECADLARVARRIFLEIIADVPDGAIINGIQRRLAVVLPPQDPPFRRRAELGGLALGESGLRKRELAERIARRSPGEALSWEMVGPAEGVAHPDIAELVDRAAGHPSVGPVRE